MDRIKIPFIVAVLKRALVQRLIAIAQRRDPKQFTAKAIEVARGIEDEDVRHEILQRLNQEYQPSVVDTVHAGVLNEAKDPFGRVLEEPDHGDRQESPRGS